MFRQTLCTRWDAWVGSLSWWRCQMSAAHSCGPLNHLNSFHRGTFRLNTKFDLDSLLYLLSHFECDGHMVYMLNQVTYCLHWLVQWSRHCAHMCIPVHSPWLLGYIDAMNTVLLILTMAGLFPDRPRISRFSLLLICCHFFFFFPSSQLLFLKYNFRTFSTNKCIST